MTGKQKKEVDPEQVDAEEALLKDVASTEASVAVEEQLGDEDSDVLISNEAVDMSVESETEDMTDAGEGVTIASLSKQMEVLKKAVTDSMDRAIRAQAELDNVRKRSSRDVENAYKYALEKFINELLPVLDSMELGIHAAESAEDVGSLREGMQLTLKMFSTLLEKSGVSQAAPQKGDKFNPDLHEAVTMQESDAAESGTVIEMMQKGYELNGRLIRPAMVVVAK